MNNTMFVGRFAKDPELRSTRNGKSVVNFILAVPRTRKDDGCDWIPVIVWDRLAELVKQYCHKGDPVAIRGHMQTRDYEVNGQKRTSVECVAEEVEFLGKKEKPQNTPAPQNFEDVADPDESLPY